MTRISFAVIVILLTADPAGAITYPYRVFSVAALASFGTESDTHVEQSIDLVWSASETASLSNPMGHASAAASLNSELGNTHITLSGDHAASAFSEDESAGWIADGGIAARIDFVIASDTHYVSNVNLSGSSKVQGFQFFKQPNGPDYSANINSSGTLTPGRYTLQMDFLVRALSGDDEGTINPSLSGSYSYALNFWTGDFNVDGKVDAADYVVWRENNINHQQGYDDWRASFGNVYSASGTGLSTNVSLPEPGSSVLLVMAIAMLCPTLGYSSAQHRREHERLPQPAHRISPEQ